MFAKMVESSRKKYSLASTTTTTGMECPLVPLDISTTMVGNNHRQQSNNVRRQSRSNYHMDPYGKYRLISFKTTFRYLLMVWIGFGIAIFLSNAVHHTRDSSHLFGLPANIIYCIAIGNHLTLIGAIIFQISWLLIIATIIQCALLVAVPALVVNVMPTLLTYSYLLSTIIMLLCYGVLYMRPSGTSNNPIDESRLDNSRSGGSFQTFNSNTNNNNNNNRTDCQRTTSNSYMVTHCSQLETNVSINNDHRHNSPQTLKPMAQSRQLLTIPRNSCQF